MRILLPLGLLLAAASFAPAADASRIIAADLLQLKQLDSPALSPDGRWVAYVVRSMVPKPDAKEEWIYRTHLWLAATAGQPAPRQITFGTTNDSDPVWSPGGEYLAFVRTAEKEKPQVRLLPLAGGESMPLTTLETGATRPRWSPDGSKVLFISSLTFAEVRAALEKAGTDPRPAWQPSRPGRTPNDTQNHVLKKKGNDPGKTEPDTPPLPLAKADGALADRREWLARNEAGGNPRTLARLNFLDERDLNPDLTFAHLFVQEIQEGAAPRDLTPGYTSFSSPEWLGDGTAIVCGGPRQLDVHPDRVESSRLYRVDPAGGGVSVFAEMPDYTLSNPLPSRDGRQVALLAHKGNVYDFSLAVVAVVPASGGSPRLLTEKLDRNATKLQWTADGTAVAFVAPSNGAFPLFRVNVATGAIARLSSRADTGVRDYDLGRDRLVQVLTTPANPSELFTGPDAAEEAKPLTKHNATWLAGKRLSAYEEHTLHRDGRGSVQFWTMRPTRFDATRKYPLLLQIHGGPAAMWGPGEESMWFEFQYFAACGYGIVFANPRGSDGYGYEYLRANYQDWGAGPASDILAAADIAARQDYIDPQRQVVTGGSYGGYMVAWIIGHDQRFAAAVAQRGVYDLLTFFGEGNAWRLVPRAFGGYPWQPETRLLLVRESPLTYVESMRTPLLVQHGDNDRRTGFVQSEMLLRSLEVLGRPVESVRYPRASHEMSRSGEPRQRIDSLVRYEEFFRRYIGDN